MYANLVGIFWVAFILYWIISAFGVKTDVKTQSWWATIVSRVVIVIIIVILLKSPYAADLYASGLGPVWGLVGTILCALGLAFAVWGRAHLGKNWSPRPAEKQSHELVTSGPYAYVRHPIYTGMLLALIGSSLVLGLIWLVVFVVTGILFVLRIKTEENYMMELFPNQYPDYKKRTKALIPFIF